MRERNRTSAGWCELARLAAWCGIGAGIASQAMLLAAALAEGRNPVRPINATSHWLGGAEAGRRDGVDLRHTGLGALTNQSAALFWGTLFAIHLARNPARGNAEILRDAAVMGIIAATVDYGLIPRRLTPGWELALSRTSVALAMAATALGLGLGGIAARSGRR